MSGPETARGRTAADERLRRRGLRLAYFIIVWDLIEGAVAITAGRLAGSAALLGFGIDSGIEVFAGAITAWQLHGGGRRRAPALRLIAVSFLALAAYVTYDAGSDLLTGERPDASLVGIGLNVVAPAAHGARSRERGPDGAVARDVDLELPVGEPARRGANAALGWWWADPVAALAIAGVAAYSGAETWREAGPVKRSTSCPGVESPAKPR